MAELTLESLANNESNVSLQYPPMKMSWWSEIEVALAPSNPTGMVVSSFDHVCVSLEKK
ncbi:anaerobic C4-dicarboxylate transporter [Vibrio mediterranei AK1]|nr:anaerobic C4-dicarboxylate transporter [Vibrio mediterranei AK1]